MAQDSYTLGMARRDPLTVLTAAKLAGSVKLTDVYRKKETKVTELARQANGNDLPVDAARMMASAKELAGEDDVLAGLAEDAIVEAGRS